MRNQKLDNAIRRLSAEAATRLSSLLASGDQIPFDVAEHGGEESFFHSYVPLTERFIAEHSADLRALPAFEPACEGVAEAGVAAPYLELLGAEVPEDAHERASQMLIYFLSSLWDGRAEFSLDHRHLAQALAELESETRDIEGDDLIVCPLVGFQMDDARLQLPSGVTIVSADSVDAPTEAMRSEGMERRPWNPQFLALVEEDEGLSGPRAAMRQLRDLISVLRLYKPGGVGLGPYAFAPTGEGRWRRIATGAGGTRPGGYTLTSAEATDLTHLARKLEARPDVDGPLGWSMTRFELGLERGTALEGLSDHLLALHALLEGEGPVGAALPVRAAALFEDGGTEDDARERVERALALERAVMSGRIEAHGEARGRAIGLSAWVENGLRGIIRGVALGDIQTDVSFAADEVLISAGLELGEGSAAQRGATSEWEMLPHATEPAEVAESKEEAPMESERDPDDELTRILEPIPGEEAEIRITALTRDDDDFEGQDDEVWEAEEPVDTPETPAPTFEEEYPRFQAFAGGADEVAESELAESDARRRVLEGADAANDWMSEISAEGGSTLEWPATGTSDPRPTHRDRVDTPRVRHLFPVPDDAEWSVPELQYDRRS